MPLRSDQAAPDKRRRRRRREVEESDHFLRHGDTSRPRRHSDERKSREPHETRDNHSVPEDQHRKAKAKRTRRSNSPVLHATPYDNDEYNHSDESDPSVPRDNHGFDRSGEASVPAGQSSRSEQYVYTDNTALLANRRIRPNEQRSKAVALQMKLEDETINFPSSHRSPLASRSLSFRAGVKGTASSLLSPGLSSMGGTTHHDTMTVGLPSSWRARHQTAFEMVRLGHISLRDAAARHRMRDRVDGGKSWQRRQKKCWGSVKLNLTQFLYSLELFKGSLKSVEGEHGTGVGSYFRFVRSLMILNIFLTLIIITIILIPQVAMKPRDYNTTLPEYNTSQYHKTHEAASTCSATYQKFLTDDVIGKRTNVEYVLDVLQGTGILEDTVLFYGQYFNRTWNEPGGKQHSYNMGMAYLCCIGAFFLLSLAVIVYFTGQGVREAMVSSEKHFNRYFNLTFSGWDYVLSKAKPVTRRQINIFREFKVGLEEQSRKRLRLEMSTAKRCRLYTIRVVINLIVLVVLGGALALIGYVTDLSGKLMKEGETYNSFVVLLIEFMPSITIAAINLILPKFFLFIVQYEGYMSETEVKWTLIRSVVLRLSSLGALIYILRNQLYQSCGEESSFGLASSRGSNNTDVQCGNCIWGITKCWESYIGQQIYKLVIFDFFIVVFKTFLYEFPRRALVQKYPKFFLFKLFGLQEFELPLQVLDIVYTQTLCWFGAYFSPLIPAITTMKCLIFFFVKKVTVLHNMVPSSRPYQASQSNYFFMIVLLLAYVLAVIPVGHVIGNFHPSQTCGPFRVYLTSSEPFHAFDMVYAFIATLPSEIQPVIQAIGATYVIVPVIIVLCLVITYYFSMASALNRTAELLKNQLALEGIDKQHLLIRIREVMHGAKVHQA